MPRLLAKAGAGADEEETQWPGRARQSELEVAGGGTTAAKEVHALSYWARRHGLRWLDVASRGATTGGERIGQW